LKRFEHNKGLETKEYVAEKNLSADPWHLSREKKGMNKRRLIIVLLIAVVIIGGVWLWKSLHRAPSANELVLYGNIDIRQVQLAFNGSERIVKMLVQEGDKVGKGQLVAVLDVQRLKHAVARSEGQVHAQKEVVARLEAGSRPEEIRKARADVESARADAYNTKLNYERLVPVVPKGGASQQQMDNAKSEADASEGKLKAAQEILNLAIAGPRKEDIAAAKATLKAYEAELALSNRELADAYLYAPDEGIIQNRITEPGDMASPQKPVYTIALTNPLWVRSYVSEPDLGKIWLGMAAEVTTDSYPGKRYRGWVGFISPTAEFTPKSVETPQIRTSLVYQARVYVCNPQNELRLGMPATVTISVNQPRTKGSSVADPCKNP
jgi:HlyD family secretion protein